MHVLHTDIGQHTCSSHNTALQVDRQHTGAKVGAGQQRPSGVDCAVTTGAPQAVSLLHPV